MDKVRQAFEGGEVDLSSDPLQPLVQRIDQDQPIAPEESQHHPTEGLGKGASGRVGLSQVVEQPRDELRFGEGSGQLLEIVGDLGADLDAADRSALSRRTAGVGDLLEASFAIDDLGVVDLGKVMILRGDPEDRNGIEPLRAQLAGQLDRGQCLEDGVERTGEETRLLSCDDGDRVRSGEAVQIGEGRLSSACRQVLFAQNTRNLDPSERLLEDLRGPFDQSCRCSPSLGLGGISRVKGCHPIEMVEKVLIESR